jgi:hypothetical protein
VVTSRIIIGNSFLEKNMAVINSFAFGTEFKMSIAESISFLWTKVINSLPSRLYELWAIGPPSKEPSGSLLSVQVH